MLLYIIATLVIALVLSIAVPRIHKSLDAKRPVPRLARNYCWPSRELIKEYDALPKGHRPLGDIKPMLKSLETRFPHVASDDRNDSPFANFNYHQDKIEYSWNNARVRPFYGSKKDQFDYNSGAAYWVELHEEFTHIRSAIQDQAERIEKQKRDAIVAGLGYDHEDMTSAVERLRAERSLIDDVTKEICK